MAKPCFKCVPMFTLALYTLVRNDNCVQSCLVRVYILGPIRPATMKNPLVQEHFIEMSEVHRETMFYPCIGTDSSSLVNVSS